ncbi:WD40-repeat-containing domain protein [Geopyxis carbonaria]|nr:WD40-repeat-containing domain protein [Geopyxis carbonaria]
MSTGKSASTSSTYQHFSTGHEDLVHDVAYDYYGRRMATVSSDQRLKVFDLNDEGEWVISDSFKAHDASINRVIWGPPEHGQIIATCSYDRTVRIWEEQEMEAKSTPNRWKRQFQMTPETRTAIHSIAFPPTFVSTSSTSTGLKLAFISSDGSLYTYECREPQDLTHWIAVDVIHVLPTPPPRESEISFCLAFCPSRWGGEQLVVGAMDTVCVYRRNATGKFRAAEELGGHRALVRDVAWAVSMGRSYHLVATACKDGHVRIFKLSGKSIVTRPVTGRSEPGGRAGLSRGLIGADEILPGPVGAASAEDEVADRWDVQMVADFGDHKAEVWKVSWNATGTILSSNGDDGKIRLWKMAINGEFQLLSVISTPRSREEMPEED